MYDGGGDYVQQGFRKDSHKQSRSQQQTNFEEKKKQEKRDKGKRKKWMDNESNTVTVTDETRNLPDDCLRRMEKEELKH